MNKSFTPSELKAFREDFNKAVKALSAQYGITLKIANITYSNSEFHTKLTGERVLDKKDAEAKERAEWNRYCGLVDLTPEDYGFVYVKDNLTLTAVAINPNAPKNSLTLRDQNGKLYKTQPITIKIAKRMAR